MNLGNVLAFVFTIIPLCAVVLLPTSTPDDSPIADVTRKENNDNVDINKDGLRAWEVADDDDDLRLLDDTLYEDEDESESMSDVFSPDYDDEFPLFILHVGPRNTGSATIQSVAANNNKLLQKDNIYFLGNNSSRPEWNTHEIYQQCSTGNQDKDQVDCDEEWSDFNERLETHRMQNHNVFVSDELLSSFPEMNGIENRHLWDELVPLLQDKWRVRVIFSYRRYFEWIYSRYAQIYNPNRWEYGGEMVEIWDIAGGKTVHSFVDYFEAVRNDNFKYPPRIKERWQEHFENVEVFNFHKEGSFIENFFCEMIPEARHLCRELGSDGIPDPPPSASTSMSHLYEMISLEAYRRGWVEISNHPADVITVVETYAKEQSINSKSGFPLECLDSTETALLRDMSVSMELEMVPEFHRSPEGRQKLLSNIEQFSNDGFFCSIDVNKLLEDDGWKQIFHSFGPQGGLELTDGSNNNSDLPIDYPQLDVELSWLGIGAQGAGTTWLAEMLMECCPTVVFGSRKELHFWDWYRRYGLGWYSNQFPDRTNNGTKLFHGEITPHYMSLPDEDIREIKAIFPDVRIIFMARDIVDRTWSGLRKSLRKEVKHGKASTLDPDNFPDDFFMKKASGRGSMERSTYEVGMERWYSHFPEDQILVLNFDDISLNPSGLLRKVLNHIGVEHPEEYLKAIEEEENQHVNSGVYTTIRPSLRKKLENLFRPHARAFNKILRNHGYSWSLNEY